MDHPLHQARPLCATIFSNAERVNKVSQQRAPFAVAAATLADSARKHSGEITAHAKSNREALNGSKSLISHILEVMTAVEEGTDLTADVETAISGFISCFTRIEQLAMNITKTAQAIDVVSLIARVEAAKAVKKGKNFAVVADQVKSLAEEAVTYARKIRNSVVALHESTDEMGARTDVLRQHMAQASEFGHTTHTHLLDISTIIDEASGFAEVTATEAMAQSQAMQEVSVHMQTLAQGVQASVQGSEANMSLAQQVVHLLAADNDIQHESATAQLDPNQQAVAEAVALVNQIATNAQAVNTASIARDNTAAATSELARSAQIQAVSGEQRLGSTQHSLRSATELLSQALDVLTRVSDATALVTNASGMVAKIRAGFADIENMASHVGDISNKTNILALNASVEASQAGVEGRGFAVVAAEVNVLAASAGEYVTEIDQLVRELSNYSDAVNESMGLLTDAFERLSAESERVRFDAKDLHTVLENAMQETRLIQELLRNQSLVMLEVGEKSEALRNDAKAAVGGSAGNLELCGQVLDFLNRLQPPDAMSA